MNRLATFLILVVLLPMLGCGGDGGPAGPGGGTGLAGLWLEREAFASKAASTDCDTEVALYESSSGSLYTRKNSDGMTFPITVTQDDASGFAFSVHLVFGGSCTYTMNGLADFSYVGGDPDRASGTGSEAWTMTGNCAGEDPEEDQTWATSARRITETGALSVSGKLSSGWGVSLSTGTAVALRGDAEHPGWIDIHALGEESAVRCRLKEEKLVVGTATLGSSDYEFLIAGYSQDGEAYCCPSSGTAEATLSALSPTHLTGTLTIHYPQSRTLTVSFDVPILSLADYPCPNEPEGGDIAPVDPAAFVGTWVAPVYTGGTARLVVAQLPGGVEIHGYGFCGGPGGGECDWETTTGLVAGDSLLAVFEFGFSTATLTIRLAGDYGIESVTAWVFHDGTNRDRTDVETFVRQATEPEPPDTTGEGFIGEWGAPVYTGGTARLVITEGGDVDFVVHGYGFCGGPGGGECDWGTTAGAVSGDSLVAVFEEGFKTNAITMRITQDGELSCRSVHVFHDGTNRDRTVIETLVRVSKDIGLKAVGPPAELSAWKGM